MRFDGGTGRTNERGTRNESESDHKPMRKTNAANGDTNESISLPKRINGWQIVAGIDTIEYRNARNTALVYYEAHTDGRFSVRIQGDECGCDRLGLFDTHQETLDAMARWLQTHDPAGYGLEVSE